MKPVNVRSITVLLIAALLSLSCSLNSKDQTLTSEDLVHMSVNLKSEGAKDLIGSFTEVKRDTHTSLVSVVSESGYVAASVMFYAKGAYKIAKARGAPYIIILKEWDGEEEGQFYSLIGFSDDNTVDVVKFYGDDVDESRDLEFMSTSELDFLWGTN